MAVRHCGKAVTLSGVIVKTEKLPSMQKTLWTAVVDHRHKPRDFAYECTRDLDRPGSLQARIRPLFIA
jgi:hypothetical protein